VRDIADVRHIALDVRGRCAHAHSTIARRGRRALGMEDLMSCTKHFLFLTWHRHQWRRTVSWAEGHVHPDTSMWGRPIGREYVTCQKQYFCKDCGRTKKSVYCGCDKERADRCAIYQAWLAAKPQHTSAAAS
jgi:hypothetical protein